MSDTNTLETIPNGTELVPASVDALLSRAIELSVPIETLERLLALRKELKAEAARDQFFAAMADFQGMKPRINKKWAVLNKDGRTIRYRFAKIDDITEKIDKPLSDCGLSYSFETDFIVENNKTLEVTTCIVKHLAGHSEKSSCRIPIEFSNAMNAAQSYATAGTYGRRYALCNALGITPDEDDDAETVHSNDELPQGQTGGVRPPQTKAQAAGDGVSRGSAEVEHDSVVTGMIQLVGDPSGNKPGYVQIGGKRYSTFDQGVLKDAEILRGKQIESVVYVKNSESKGKVYENAVLVEASKKEPATKEPEQASLPDSPM